MIMNFFYFHICLVSENRTTIDTLEMKRGNLDPSTHTNIYDKGFYLHKHFIYNLFFKSIKKLVISNWNE